MIRIGGRKGQSGRTQRLQINGLKGRGWQRSQKRSFLWLYA